MSINFTRALLQKRDPATLEELQKNPSLPVPFIASTPGTKADGLDLRMEDWDLARFEQYPVILFGHNYHDGLPIGLGRASVEEDHLRIDVTYDVDDDFAMAVRSKALKGMLAGSVGWMSFRETGEDDEGNEVENTRNELLEFSMVPVPMDPAAMPDLERAGLLDVGKRLLEIYPDLLKSSERSDNGTQTPPEGDNDPEGDEGVGGEESNRTGEPDASDDLSEVAARLEKTIKDEIGILAGVIESALEHVGPRDGGGNDDPAPSDEEAFLLDLRSTFATNEEDK